MKRHDDEPVLPQRTTDETAVGWGDDEPTEPDDLQRLLEDRPPHHVERDD